MKFLCPGCDRLVELQEFTLDGPVLVLTCPACSASSRVSPPSPPAPVPLTPVISSSLPSSGHGAPSGSALGERPAGQPSSGPGAPIGSSGERPAGQPGSGHGSPIGSSLGERAGASIGPAPQLSSVRGASNVVMLRSPATEAVAAAAQAAARGPFEVPEGRCPKCLGPRRAEVLACSQCGLTFAQFDPEQVAPPPWLQQGWTELLADWGNGDRHAELRQRALAEQDLASVGRLYRLRLATNPEDPFAQRGRDEVLRLALVPGAESRSSPLTEKLDPKWKYVVGVIAFLFCLGLLALMARAMLSAQ